jgi:membrane protease YdiL (CAAX protease family)
MVRNMGFPMIRALWEKLIGTTIREVEQEARTATAESPLGIDTKTVWVLVTVCVCLTLQNFTQSLYSAGEAADHVIGMADGDTARHVQLWLYRQADFPEYRWTWWGIITTLTYFVFPVAVVKLVFRENLRDYGVKWKGALSSWPIYVGMLGIMLPLIYFVSFSPRFLVTYPMYGVSHGMKLPWQFWLFEVVYALQFCTLEFFFRGFMVHGLKHRFGVGSVFIMMVPYCMIHFQKPLPECCGSIVAGFALGLISLKTRSVWLGAALHISVAFTMDTFACIRKGVVL